MSELAASAGRRRRRRADAERSIAAIVEAAVQVLGERPTAGLEDIASAAGVTRQTIYAHFDSRDALLDAVIDRATNDTAAAMAAAHLDRGPPSDALLRWIDAGWQILDRYPLLLHVPAPATDPDTDRARHQPIVEPLQQLIRRGQRSGDFDPRAPAHWLAAATVALAHAAAQHVATGQMSNRHARATLRRSVLRLLGAPPPG